MKKKFDEDSPICYSCLKDAELSNFVKRDGTADVCALCRKRRRAVTIHEIAALLDPIIRDHFHHGSFGYSGEQEGDDLSWVLQEVLGDCLDCEDALIKALEDGDNYDFAAGEEAFFDATTYYKPTRIHTYLQHSEWNDVKEELAHERRFFSAHAKEFFDWLFEELDHLSAPADPALSKGFTEGVANEPQSVVRELPAGTQIFRARTTNSKAALLAALSQPAGALGPPPSANARAGRMNAEGICVFYGALDAETCIAELRPSIKGEVVVGAFATTETFRILDFRTLDRAYFGTKQLSYFQSDFKAQLERRKFLRGLHRLISLPILPGRENDYLITQTLAEYLAHVRNPRFAGLLFQSAQRAGGTNIVIFPRSKAYDELGNVPDMAPFRLEFLGDASVKLFRTEAIKYENVEVHFSLSNGDVFVHSDRDHYDEDDD